MSPCPECEKALNRLGGVYRMDCVACCARLVRSARPSRQRQEAMLAFIERHDDAPRREDVLKEMKNEKITH